MLRVLWAILALLAILATTLGFLGPWLGMADAFAVIRFPAALALALLLLPVMRKPWLFLPALALSAFGLVSTLEPFVKAQALGPVTLLPEKPFLPHGGPQRTSRGYPCHEARYHHPPRSHRSPPNRDFRALSKAYPTQAFCPFAGVGGTAVLSRWPAATPPVCPAAKGATVQPLTTPFGRITAVSLHLHWPWPYGQRAHLEALIPELQALTGSFLLGGDFNMVPWGWPVMATAKATHTQKAAPRHELPDRGPSTHPDRPRLRPPRRPDRTPPQTRLGPLRPSRAPPALSLSPNTRRLSIAKAAWRIFERPTAPRAGALRC